MVRGKWLVLCISLLDYLGSGCSARVARSSCAEIMLSNSGCGWKRKECTSGGGGWI